MNYEEKMEYFATIDTSVGQTCPNCVLNGVKSVISQNMDQAKCPRCGWRYGSVIGLPAENGGDATLVSPNDYAWPTEEEMTTRFSNRFPLKLSKKDGYKPDDPIPGTESHEPKDYRPMDEFPPRAGDAYEEKVTVYSDGREFRQYVPAKSLGKVYIAGPMTGIQDNNAPAFRAATGKLRDWGFRVISPVELDEADGFGPDGMTGKGDSKWKEFLKCDLLRFLEQDVDAIVVLEGWERSKGATLEVAVAQAFDIPVLVYPDLAVYGGVVEKAGRHPRSARFHEILAELGELHDRKQQDYGRKTDPFSNVRAAEEWNIDPWVGAMIRANDKIRRLQSFAAKGTLANESVEDAFKDLAVYAVIGLVLFEAGLNPETKG